MTPDEHLAVALRLRELAHELTQRNQSIAAGEMLWGAANRIIKAVNLRHGIIPADRPLRRNTVIRHLEAQYQGSPTLRQGLSAVGRLHGHFYNSDLSDQQIASYTRGAENFIAALLNLPETHAIPQA